MSSPPGQSTEKRMRAIDRLDQHMIKRSKSNNRASSPVPFLSWITQKLPPPSSLLGQRDAPTQTSPSPKRRKTRSLSPSKIAEPRNSHVGTIPDENRYGTGANSSPIKKSVAFSDKLESSPTQRSPRSSPRPTSVSKPSKSILRKNADTVRKSANDVTVRRSELMLTSRIGSASLENNSGAVDPHSVDYWVGGEVHSMLEFNNVHEFKNIVEGGLKFLSQKDAVSITKRFEIYATFNNIMPVIPGKGSSEIAERKINVLIDHMDIVVDVCLSHLEEEQEKLLSTNSKKDPFVSRLYVQIVRFLNSILSNFKIIKWLTNKPQLQLKFKSIYRYSIEALTHNNTNKVIVAAQVAFLGDVKFGSFFLNDEELTSIIHTIPTIKEIQSTNLICEKLILIKNLLAKYPRLMIENVSLWLCGEVLPRILIDSEINCSKIVLTAVSTILDLLKKCLDVSKGHEDIYNSVQICTVREVVPAKLLPKLLPSQNDPENIISQTLGQLLRKQLKYLILVKQEYKLAMDLWLAMTGLLYNSTDRLQQLTSATDREWLDLNFLCFQAEDPQAKLLAIKVWRILTYSICSHLETFSTENLRIIKLLQRPFTFSREDEYDFNIMEGLLFHLTGIIYTAFSGTNNLSSTKFDLFWEHLVRPIYVERILISQSIQLKARANALLLRLLGGKIAEPQNKQVCKKIVHSIKIIASAGVTARDIQPLPLNVIKSSYEAIKVLVFQAIESDSSNLCQNFDLITALLKLLPNKFVDKEHLREFTNAIFEVAIQRKEDQNLAEMFIQITCCLATQFATLFFNEMKIFEEYLSKFGFILLANGETKIKLLKELIVGLRGKMSEFFIIEAFLQQGDLSTKEYVSNWIGSMLLSPTMPHEHFSSLVNIVTLIPTTEVLENFLNLSSKVTYDVDLFSLLNIQNWEVQGIIIFVKNSILRNHNAIKPELNLFLQSVLPNSTPIFSEMLPFLCGANHYNIVRYTLTKSPKFLNLTTSVDKKSFDEILPLEILPVFLQSLSDYQDTIQLRILQWSMEHNQINMLFGHYETLEHYLFKKEYNTEESSRRNQLLLDLLSSLLVGKNWLYMGKIIQSCMKNGQASPVTKTFSENDRESLFWLTPVTLASMINKCGSLNSSLIEVIKKCFSRKPVDFNIELTRELIDRNESQVFFLCGKEVVAFFTVRSRMFPLSEQDAISALFEMLMTSLMCQKDSLILDFVQELYANIPQECDSHLLKILIIAVKKLQAKGKHLKKYDRYHRISGELLSILSNLTITSENVGSKDDSARETSQNNESNFTEKISKISMDPKSNAVDSHDRLEIQVYATQTKATQIEEPVSLEKKSKNDEGRHISSDHSVAENRDLSEETTIQSNINYNKEGPEDTTSINTGKSASQNILEVQKSKVSKVESTDIAFVSSPSCQKTLFDRDSSTNVTKTNDAVLESTASLERGDDFAPVNVAPKDDFLEKMEEKIKIKNQESSEQIKGIEENHKDVSQMSQIRIPIFNSSKLQNKLDLEGPRSDKGKETLREARDTSVGKACDRDAKHSQGADLESSQEDNESHNVDNTSKEDYSKEPTPILRLHFPSKKARKLVSRLRGFTVEDVSKISPEEKRNLRIELLDFMMKLEHESLNGEF
ncbi:RIF1 (YBR275C) [Zygosaccharomyces parabailii]|nr:RIF1 (YBR275C) [Zygosaccharomyces parabailii]